MEDSSEKPVKELWRHAAPEKTEMFAFHAYVKQKHHLSLASYADLHQWSVSHPGTFWEDLLLWARIKLQSPYTSVLDSAAPMYPRPLFFPGCSLNFAENLLFPPSEPSPDAMALVAATENSRERITWRSLRERVGRCSQAMRAQGLQSGDRIACYVGNHANAVVILLACLSIGAVWTAISPDTGVTAVLDRLTQIEPTLFFADNASFYNGKTHSTQEKVFEIISSLRSLKAAIVLPAVADHPFDMNVQQGTLDCTILTFDTFLSSARPPYTSNFTALPPDHPIYILFSSGTTGTPKPIVHSSLGVLLQHRKEHSLHCDIRKGDTFFYYTTTTWMMHPWLVSGLATGACLVLYDGSPFQPHRQMSLPLLIDELHISHFGTSAKYLSLLEQSYLLPRKQDPPSHLQSLRAIFSTGSPLAPSTFEYTYTAFGPDIMLGSITGGTDIVSLFGAPNPLLPVHAGEIQCAGLGMSVRCYHPSIGRDITETGEPGDLVCDVPFPCQPAMFWPPGTEGEQKYRSSYFDTFAKHAVKPRQMVWHHGDFVKINPITGGMWMLGRSDGVLKPGGVRFGSSEIYNVILKYFSDEVEDSLCIGRRREGDSDETVVLFLRMARGQELNSDLLDRIKQTIRTELSARHVPGIVDVAPEIPVTVNGKKVEGAVKQILCGMNIKTSASVANPGCLDFYRRWAQDHAG